MMGKKQIGKIRGKKQIRGTGRGRGRERVWKIASSKPDYFRTSGTQTLYRDRSFGATGSHLHHLLELKYGWVALQLVELSTSRNFSYSGY